ncbi:TonB-dependent receptor [Flavobacterium sp.]
MKIKLLLLTILFSALGLAQTKGTVKGILTDKDANNIPLAFANATLKGTSTGVTTNEKGEYSISVAPGNYVIVFSFIGYENVETPITIKAGETIIVNKALGSGGYKLEDVVIQKTASREKETALLLDQKKAVEIKQSIGAQEMSRKGISDVEEGLTKITGITKVDGRGLFVRGLEDRYNNLLINDLQAPSNSPFKKIIPLDLFPTDIVGVLSIYKTFNPNISGDFAGATVNIETSQAKGSVTKLSIGLGYTTDNNGEKFLISSDANNTQGTLGLIGDDRELPSIFGSTPSGIRLSSTESAELYKNNTWNVDEVKSPINTSISVLHADKFKFKNATNLNYIISLNTENKSTIREGVDRTFNQGQGNYDKNMVFSQYNYQTSSSALVGLKYKADRFNVAYNTFYLRSTESKIQDQLGYTNSLVNNPNQIIRVNQFEQSDYFNNQLLGEYNITKDKRHTVKVGGSFVKTTFGQPDRKFIVGNKINDTEISTTYGGNNLNRQHLKVKGNYYVSGLLEYNLKFKENKNGKTNKLAIGYNTFRNDLSSTYRFLSGKPFPGLSTTLITNLNSIDAQISSDISNGILSITEETNAEYKVKLNQFVNAGYFNLLWNFGKSLEVNGGIRFENSDRIIKYRPISFSIDDPYEKLTVKKLYILPSANLKFSLTEKTNFRFAVSNTITRPVTMELLPITYVDPDGSAIVGNSNLKDAENLNIDLKYELFPNNKELMVVGLFGKSIKNPIERVFLPASGGQISNYQNSKSAVLFGAELELLLQLSRISSSLSNFSLGFNTSLMKTDVTVDLTQNTIENNSKRKLQGASDWLANADLKYEFEFNKTMKNTMSLVYGVYGDRIYAVGTAGIDHIYEKSFSKLDFVWSSKISKNIDVKFAVDNILNPSYKLELGKESTVNITENSLLMRDYKRGVGYSLNISYTF